MTPKNEAVKENRPRLVGVAGVDSGHLLIGDPCYFELDADAFSAHESPTQTRQLSFENGIPCRGVTVSTGGDSVFPVFVEYEHGEAVRIVVDLNHDVNLVTAFYDDLCCKPASR